MVLLACISCKQKYPYQDPSLSPDERANDLLDRLTLEEKVQLMMNNSPGVERLGILPYEWWNEALHGVGRAGQATVFPQVIGLAATFDDDAVYKTYSMVSDEARAKHHDFKRKGEFKRYQGLTFWTPNINIFRDPRWGRGMETYGEDPYLTTQMGVAVVKGLQGDGTEKYDKLHACAKHYAVHSGPEWNRHSYDAKNISERDLRETYLPAFKALVKDAGVKEVMCAYNRFEGLPCCSSDELLIHILREEWGFDDIVVSDCGAINDFYEEGRHETYPDAATASAAAVIAGTDLECGRVYQALNDAVKQGLISEEQINKSLFRLLRARFQLGLMDDDNLVPWSSIPLSVVESDEHKAMALEMARKSIVLLNNKNNILPLNKNLKKVAVMGPAANDSVMLWANYNGFPTKSVTLLEGIRNKLPEGSVIYEKGCDYVTSLVFNSLFNQCVYNGQKGFNAKFWNNNNFEGDVVAEQLVTSPFEYDTRGNTVYAQGVNLTNFSARFESVFTPANNGEVVFKIAGEDRYKLLIDGKDVASATTGRFTTREYQMKAQKGKSYDIVIEYTHNDGNGSLSFDVGYTEEPNYDAIAAKVKDAEVIIFTGGISSALEGEEMNVNLPGFKQGDRTNIDLPEVQANLLKALKKLNKPIVFVLCSGSTMALPWQDKNLDAILAAWYPGQEGGTAVADVIFGDYNPAGRLPLTFYASSNDLPDFEDYDMSKGRTYRYFKGKPLYPFGYGLSYTTFEYTNASLDKQNLKTDEPAKLTVDIRNSGKMDGDEVVQVYVRNLQDKEGPMKSLRAFKRVFIKAGETKTTSIDLPADTFEFFDPEGEVMRVKPGKYEVLYGPSSDDKVLTKLMVDIN